MKGSFQLVDVFCDGPYSGNPLAVVFDADDLDTAQMQAITRWLNLSETTFLLTPTQAEADYRVRIFTLDREMPFAGHPTLGSCHAWLSAGGRPRRGTAIVQECGAGLVDVQSRDDGLYFRAPPLVRAGPVERNTWLEIAAFLRIEPSAIIDARWADNGPGWVVVLLESATAVLDLEPARDHPSRIDLGVVGPYPDGGAIAFELRAFFTDAQGAVREDPVTGSLNASTAQWLLDSGRATAPYTTSQGTRLGRTGRVRIKTDREGAVWVGGRSVTRFAGSRSG